MRFSFYSHNFFPQVAAAVLSDRYISDRFLPDKAIDLMDEASAKACQWMLMAFRYILIHDESWCIYVLDACHFFCQPSRCFDRTDLAERLPLNGDILHEQLELPMTVSVSQVKMEVTSKPAELERVDRKILQPLGFTHHQISSNFISLFRWKCICGVHLTCDPIMS